MMKTLLKIKDPASYTQAKSMSETCCATGLFCIYIQLSNVFWQQLEFLPRSLHLFDLLLKDVTEQVGLHFKYLSRNKLLNTDII